MFIAIGTTLLGLIGKKGVSGKAARMVGIGALAVGVVLVFLLWLAIHDANVRDDALDDQDAEINAAVIGADRAATAAQDQRDANFANSQGGIDNAVDAAVAGKPAETRKPVGPASQSYYDELRRQREREKRR
jgi:hypothetical protein